MGSPNDQQNAVSQERRGEGERARNGADSQAACCLRGVRAFVRLGMAEGQRHSFASARFDSELAVGCCLSNARENDDSPTATIEDAADLVALENCRMCFEGQTSNDDPVVPLGCKCLGENSRAHESCIQKWFPNQFMRRGRLQCEVCKSALGRRARATVMKVVRPRMVQILLQRGLRQVVRTVDHLENELIRVFFPPLHPFFANPGRTPLSPPEDRLIFPMDLP